MKLPNGLFPPVLVWIFFHDGGWDAGSGRSLSRLTCSSIIGVAHIHDLHHLIRAACALTIFGRSDKRLRDGRKKGRKKERENPPTHLFLPLLQTVI